MSENRSRMLVFSGAQHHEYLAQNYAIRCRTNSQFSGISFDRFVRSPQLNDHDASPRRHVALRAIFEAV